MKFTISLFLLVTISLNSCVNTGSTKLKQSICIETFGGTSTVLIPKGTELPTSYTEVFSTALDNQSRVEVHLLRGDSPKASENTSAGKFQINGIRPAPRGEPQIQIKIKVNSNEEIEVSAKDIDTGEEQTITIFGK